MGRKKSKSSQTCEIVNKNYMETINTKDVLSYNLYRMKNQKNLEKESDIC